MKRSRNKVTAGPAQAGRAHTIVFIHGIGNKPPPNVLKLHWDKALLGFDLGERSRLAYWVNRELHGPPLGDALDPDEAHALAPKNATPGVRAKGIGAPPSPGPGAAAEAALERIRAQMDRAQRSSAEKTTRVLPLPGFARDWVSRMVTGWLLEDVRDFLFIPERRQAMRESLIARLRTGGGPFVVVAHSQGTMIAYDVLSNWGRSPGDPPIEVPLFITLGSPLGLTEVQDQLKKTTGQKRLATPSVVGRWENFADRADPVALDAELAGDFATNARKVGPRDHRVNNPVASNPHSGIGYLSLREVRSAVLEVIETPLFQPVSEFTIARNLNQQLTSAHDLDRHDVLIELQDRPPDTASATLTDPAHVERLPTDARTYESLASSRERVVNWLRAERWRLTKTGQPTKADLPALDDDLGLEALEAYVSARLTRPEIERLSVSLRNAAVYRVFRNGSKRIHLRDSIQSVQARTAHLGYDALGQGITWAVLDTGVDWTHWHFREERNIERVFDCTPRGNHPVALETLVEAPTRGTTGWDGNGHGTHVAGIVGGHMPSLRISGIAPRVRLWSYKVLDDDGGGGDAKIIKALDHIHEVNRSSPALRIHGVNLSLGGPFDVETFGCGDTPLCKCLRRLWRQGVLVVVSAGNEGYAQVPGLGPVSMDLSIGDPANLDECIVVGSVHSTKPHLYGVSYFSSRGPTADGRAKPDVVAPGEKILSCLAGAAGDRPTLESHYTRMSGTSMAAPHVSGVLACFLSARREFIGFPDRVKHHLLQHATDLARDRMHQGAGLVNLVKMLINT